MRPTILQTKGPKKILNSKKGFYLVSPFLGFLFFLITVSVSMVMVTENNQQIETARASEGHALIFNSYAIQADVFDVYFQNYLQGVLDNHQIANGSAIRTELEDRSRSALSRYLEQTYQTVYKNAFGINCTTVERAYSLVILNLNNMGVDVIGTRRIFSVNPFTGRGQVTAMWPYASRYALRCGMEEPPINSTIDFTSRWYFLDANCICCQELGYAACALFAPAFDTRGCPYCAT